MRPAFQITRPLLLTILAAGLSHLAPLRAVAHGDLDARIETLTRQIEQEPRNANLRLQRADTLRHHREFPAALADVTEAEKLQAEQPAVDLQRARIWFDAEQFPQAVRAASACLTRAVTNAEPLVIRARSRARLGQLAEAVKDFSSALAHASAPLPDLYLERAECQAALGRLADAVRGLDEGLTRLGQSPSLAFPAMDYERRQGAFTAALARLEQARPFYDRESFLALRGEILLQAGRPAEAARDFQTALDSVEKFSPARRESPPAQELATRLRDGLKRTTPTLETK